MDTSNSEEMITKTFIMIWLVTRQSERLYYLKLNVGLKCYAFKEAIENR